MNPAGERGDSEEPGIGPESGCTGQRPALRDSMNAMEGGDAPEQAPGAPAPPWAAFKEYELLAMRFCDLGLRLEGSELEAPVQQLRAELAARGLRFIPDCYLGDEWFSPDGVPAIAIPFYLAHPRLRTLELHQMMEVEGGTPEACMNLLRHECGHAIDHAWEFSKRAEWEEIFGNPEDSYEPETYRPQPYSHSFVRHLPNWYAQAHPDEDFAETFAVWLSAPMDELRRRYEGWKALGKIEYVERLMQEAASTPPKVRGGRRMSEVRRLRKTLARHYAVRRKLYAEDFPDFYDADLRAIFLKGEPGADSAARAMRRHRAALIAAIVQWTGQRRYTVDMLLRKLTLRCQALKLPSPRDPVTLHMELAAYLSALVTNHLYTGKFKRSV
ncbi:MAG TPA: putative zinc-binding metallopeptidase [Bryobacteraceae bacterium]|nr:putative zinc-binding metallopeptidase [Bryobacteraceae bacterium]